MKGVLVRKRILDLHLYLGLLCAPYLILYGVSGLAFNHGWPGDPTPGGSWEARFEAPAPGVPADAPLDLARAIQADQGLIGWVEEASLVAPDAGGLHFTVHRPGAEYHVVLAPDGALEVSRVRTGIWRVLQGMHGLRRLEGSLLAPLWWVYTEASVWVLVFACLSGIYLWARTSHMILGISTISLGALAYAVLAVGVW